MLEDRPYMRPEEPQFRGSPMQQPWSGWAILLTINVVVYILQLLIDPKYEDVFRWGILDTSELSWLTPVHLITYQFLHGDTWHLFINVLMLFFLGRPLEQQIGRREMIALYLVGGIVGAFVQFAFGLVNAELFAGPLIGASAAVMGIMGTLARLNPRQEVYLLLFFLVPVRMKWNWIFLGTVVVSLLWILSAYQYQTRGQVAHAAHLGGLLYGAFYAAKLVRAGGLMRFLPGMPRIRFVSNDPSKGSRATRRRNWRKPRVVDAAEVAEEDFMSREVDPILDKISKQGIHSLTERERKILDKARSKM
jgi:membrane associated rhomboid family serine protease